MRKFMQEITTVDGGGHPRLYPSAKEISVIFGYWWKFDTFHQ
jgi:hypothetical protein